MSDKSKLSDTTDDEREERQDCGATRRCNTRSRHGVQYVNKENEGVWRGQVALDAEKDNPRLPTELRNRKLLSTNCFGTAAEAGKAVDR